MTVPLIDIDWGLAAALAVAAWILWQVFCVRRPR